MKIAISTYSFHRLIQAGKMTQIDCVKAAHNLGFDAIEFVDVIPPAQNDISEYAGKLRQECQKFGLEISNFTFSADFLNGSQGNIHKEIEYVKSQIEIAHILGAQSVRHDVTTGYPSHRYQSFETVLPFLADACREITEYANKLGIRTMIENHGQFCQESQRVESLINAVNHKNFGLLADMGNFLCADENPATAFARIAPYACYVHAKDFHFKHAQDINPGEGFFRTRAGNYLRGAIIGHGIVPVMQCLSILKANHYAGMIAIEFEGMEDNFTGIRIGFDNLKKYLSLVDL